MSILRARGVAGAAMIGAAGVVGLLAAGGCEKKAQTTAAVETADLGTPSAVYTVRGTVAMLPVAGSPTSDFQVRHEAIDNFVDSNGHVVGMGAMVMPFPLDEGVSLAGLRTDDVVEVTFAVWWEPRLLWKATKVEKLPSDTPLEFREARPPRPDEGGVDTGEAQPPPQ